MFGLVNKYGGSFSTLNDPYAEFCVPEKQKIYN